MRKSLIALILAIFAAAAFGQDISLPKPQAKLGIDVLEAIRARQAVRAFVKAEAPAADLAAVAWAANGLKGTPDAMSSASKAGGTFPVSGDVNYVNLYVLTSRGVYRYIPESGTLKQVDGKDARSAVTSENIATSSFMLLFTYDATKLPSFAKGNAALGKNFAFGTASFGGENAALVGAGLKLASIVMYNVNAPATAGVAKLGKDEAPLFLMQFGYVK